MNVPPLLADLIRHVAAARGLTLTETTGAADVIILGPAATASPPAQVPVITISPDLTRITGPGPGDCVPFTPATLASLLRKIAMKI